MKGRVISIRGEAIIVRSSNNDYSCSLRGILKKEKTHKKNLIAVGDLVQFTLSNNQGVIEEIKERFSFLTRKDIVKNKEQLIAVNIEQVLVTMSVVAPPLKPPLIDRYLIACEKGNMHPILVFNKMDLLEKNPFDKHIQKEENCYKECLCAYEKLQLPIISVSAIENKGIEQLKKLMAQKTSVFSGPSGVGKSSLINKICNINLPTKETVKKTRKGVHTTTTASLIPIDQEGFIIDTPGIKSFGIWDLTLKDITNHFYDIQKIGEECRFANCLHIKEPDCAVKIALEKRQLSSLRFASYLSLIESLGKKDRRR